MPLEEEGCQCSLVCWHFQCTVSQGLVTTYELFLWEQEADQRPFGILELSKTLSGSHSPSNSHQTSSGTLTQVGRIDSARVVLCPHIHPHLAMLKYMVFPGEHAADMRAHTVALAQFVQYKSHFCDPNGQKNRHLVLLRSNAQAGWL